jgi:hypothetical protein
MSGPSDIHAAPAATIRPERLPLADGVAATGGAALPVVVKGSLTNCSPALSFRLIIAEDAPAVRVRRDKSLTMMITPGQL